MADDQHEKVLKLEPRRGAVYDRYKEPLAINLEMKSIFADPRYVEDKERTADVLSRMLDVDKSLVLDRLNKDKAFVWIKRKVDLDEAEKVKKLNLKGIHFVPESRRNYPNDSMAAHVIGFAGLDNKGLEGLELKYDDKLKGEPGYRHLLRDARRRTVLFNDRDSIPAKDGYNITLTLDTVVQYITEEELEKMVKKYNATSASAIVMDPFTGEILALANYPTYNLNEFSESLISERKDSAVTDVYEPGSVFKIVTASAALNEGTVSLDDKFDCENGEYSVGGRILHDYHAYDELTFKDVIAKSSNIGTVKVAEKVGKEKVYEYIKRFGFGENTGIELPGEVPGISRPPSVWSRSDITTIPIGQGIAVTSLQLACALSVIANGGYLVQPYIIDNISTWEGVIYKKFKPFLKREVISTDTAEKTKEMLREVVTTGTARNINAKKYDICGKTGTAQMVNPKGGYYDNKYYATFIAFAPKDEPRVCVVVVAKDPHPGHFGGVVAGPAVKNIIDRTLEYMGVPVNSEQ